MRDGAAVRAVDADGWTPLHDAARLATISRRRRARLARVHPDRVEIATILLRAGADVEAIDAAGWTPLHTACWAGNADMVVTLLEGGADASRKNASENAPLHLAARRGPAASVEALIAAGASPDQRRGRDGRSPLELAALAGKCSLLPVLMRAGATPAPDLARSGAVSRRCRAYLARVERAGGFSKYASTKKSAAVAVVARCVGGSLPDDVLPTVADFLVHAGYY